MAGPPSCSSTAGTSPFLDGGDVVLSLVSTISTLGAPLGVAASELAIEAFYPADDTTQAWLEARHAPVANGASH